MRLKKILIEIDEENLSSLVWEFREKWEEKYNWQNDKLCFKNSCQFITKKLKSFLEEHGYEVKRVGGYYYPSKKWFQVNNEPYKDGKWKHWWLEVNNEYVVDITADQFHPEEREGYRVVITNKSDMSYDKV